MFGLVMWSIAVVADLSAERRPIFNRRLSYLLSTSLFSEIQLDSFLIKLVT